MIDHLTSRAKVKVLQVLSKVPRLYLREIALFTGLPIRSVQIATRDLLKKKLLSKKKIMNRTFYQLNMQHEDVVFFQMLFYMNDTHQIQKNAKLYSVYAPEILLFISQIYQTTQESRRS